MDRRRFGVLAAATAANPKAFGRESAPETLHLQPNGWMPNNQALPVLLYREAFLPGTPDLASVMEAAFARNGWPPQWRDGVYDFHHYHSTAHEVLGFAGGSARLILGGQGGHELAVRTGDVAVLPCGTGHCRLQAEAGFLVVGAYPPGQAWDICRSELDAEARVRMKKLPFPASDPLHGRSGPLLDLWRTA